MKRYLNIAAAVFAAAALVIGSSSLMPGNTAYAQFGNGQLLQRGTISVDEGTVTVSDLRDVSSFGVSVVNSGTYVLQFEGSVDGGRNYVSVYGTVNNGTGNLATTTTDVGGTWFFTNTGLTHFRVRASAYTSGAPIVTIIRGYAKGGGSGGGSNLTPGDIGNALVYSNGAAFSGYAGDICGTGLFTTALGANGAVACGSPLQINGPINPYLAGRFYTLGQDQASSFNQGNLTNNNGYLGAFRPSRTITFDQLGVQVVTGNASTAVNIVVYDDDATGGFPGTLLYSSGSVATTSSNTYAFASSTLPTFTAGNLYWVGVLASGTSPNVRLWQTGHGFNAGMESGIQNGNEHLIQQSGLTFASPPNPWGFAATQLVSGTPPVLVGRAP